MRIHFVCSGNTNRSRMAEAYLKSKNISGIKVSSSGIYATHNLNGSLSKYAQTVLKEYNILDYASIAWIQTTKEILESADLVIFMSDRQFEFCRNELKCIPKEYFIWNIGDVNFNPRGDNQEEQKIKTKEDEDIFQQVKRKVDELIKIVN